MSKINRLDFGDDPTEDPDQRFLNPHQDPDTEIFYCPAAWLISLSVEDISSYKTKLKYKTKEINARSKAGDCSRSRRHTSGHCRPTVSTITNAKVYRC